MQIIENTVQYCQYIARKIGHSIGEFRLIIFSDERYAIVALCENNCQWGISFDPLCQAKFRFFLPRIIEPEYGLCLTGDCTIHRAKLKGNPTFDESLGMAFEEYDWNQTLNETTGGSLTMNFAPLSERQLLICNLIPMILVNYLNHFSQKELAYRATRQAEIETQLKERFPVIYLKDLPLTRLS